MDLVASKILPGCMGLAASQETQMRACDAEMWDTSRLSACEMQPAEQALSGLPGSAVWLVLACCLYLFLTGLWLALLCS